MVWGHKSQEVEQATKQQEVMSSGNSAAADASVSTAHGAKEYEAAVNAVADVLEDAIKYIPSSGKAGSVRKMAQKAVPSLRKAASAIAAFAPAIDAAVEQAPEAARAVGDAATKAGEAVATAATDAAHAVADPMSAALADMQAERARKEAQKQARKSIIEHAGVNLPLAKFQENYDTHAQLLAGGPAGGAAFPGCYVVLRIGKGLVLDMSDYKDVYVGMADDMWEAVSRELAGDGNPDVYADAKYDAGVQILMYPCPSDQVARLRDALIVALDADVSYNARELQETSS